MQLRVGTILTLLVAAIYCVKGECDTWQTEVNISMCNWQGLRANVIRDTIYIDGGQLWLQQGFSDGCVNYVNDGNLEGSIYLLNLSTPFNISSNFMNVLSNASIAGGAANNIAPNYVDGVMIANDDEFYLYGGMLRFTNGSEPPPDNEVLGYEAYQYGPFRKNWEPGWNEETLSTNVTRYITNGAGVSVPSENMGFYFSGMRAPDWGPFTLDGMESNATADTLITVNMKDMREEKWTNDTLPNRIPGRANAELVWVPVSESGVLVAVGGVVDPVGFWRDTGLGASQTALSISISPTFMETVSVYDVNTQEWYLQNTTGDTPPQLTQFCSVLASAADSSSHNIYIYGGYNGLQYDTSPSDDVYILSLPSFTWVKAYSGVPSHGRSGHKCIKVYPNQMLAVGGQRVDPTNCLEGGVIINFNLNSLNFQDYDPSEWSDYEVPDVLTAKIGGNSSGSATANSPSAWTNSSLAAIFDKKYTKSITTYWPYDKSSGSTDTTKSSRFPTWAAAVIGVLCGLSLVALLIGYCYHRGRRNKHTSALVEEAKAVGTRGATNLTYEGDPTSPRSGPASEVTVESGGDAVYEMHDSSPVELPTQFHAFFSSLNPYPQPSPTQSFPSPVSPQTPAGSESGTSNSPTRRGRPKSLSAIPSRSINQVVTGRMSLFAEYFDSANWQRGGHGSEVSMSEPIVTSEERADTRRIPGSDTIHEKE